MNEQAPQACVQRKAFYLQSQGDWLLAWLHQPAGGACLAHGVVICAPLGVEQLNAHRAIRHLADAVAAQGFMVIRFDYAGTGDSSGRDEDPRRVDTWLANIRDVTEWMRRQLACRHISLAGVRLGAALAARFAADQDVENLVLWAPVVKGSRYCRELKAVSRMAEGGNAGISDPEGLINAAGFVSTQETVAAISTMDLLQSTPRCARVLLVDRNDAAANTLLRDHYLGWGLAVEHAVQPGYIDMMAEPHYTRVPVEAITHIARWFGAQGGTGGAMAGVPSLLNQITLTPGHGYAIHERLCPISSEPDLFGILCEPEHCADDSRPLIILLSAGTAHHIGPGRLYVQLARQLAVQGFRSLRMDFCGVGDSVLADIERENNAYAATAFRDIQLALRYVETQCGAPRIVLAGLCSGAYYAFQSAVQLNDSALVESLLLNPRTYFWKDGMSLGDTRLARESALHYYLNAVTDFQKWKRLLSGNSDEGIVGGIKLFVRRMFAPGGPKAANPSTLVAGVAVDGASHPASENLPGNLARIMQAGRKLALFCATTDPGHFLLMMKARRAATRMNRGGQFDWYFIENADHTFSTPAAKDAVVAKILEHLCRRYQRRPH